ncbi:MAG: DUF1963 domain-containing protein, partial [Saprospiraceae bacterium]
MSFKLSLPTQLESFRDLLMQTKQTFIRVKSQDTRKTRLWESKVGGQPYLPKNASWPCNVDGEELYFLAQI